MPNKTYALEWLFLANRNLETAKLLFGENHYTDIIAIEIHHTVEKTIKAILAFNGHQIPRIHLLPELFELCNSYVNLKDISIENLFEISDYFESERYPGPGYFIPSREEIDRNLKLAISMYEKVLEYINKCG